MRMWLINPKLLCDKHLLGEHGELHKHRHNFVKKHNMDTRIIRGQIQVNDMKIRHDELAQEMLSRGFKHQSPYEMPDISYIPEELINRKVDIEKNIEDLKSRCEKCRDIINKGGKS
jgi:hypothetical protein